MGKSRIDGVGCRDNGIEGGGREDEIKYINTTHCNSNFKTSFRVNFLKELKYHQLSLRKMIFFKCLVLSTLLNIQID